MISTKRRGRPSKLSKTLERAFKREKCLDCSVVVTRMDFARILGKFTKVKIQYESSTTPKTKPIQPTPPVTSPNSNARLKSNENGMVLIHRNAYNQHPVKELTSSRKPKTNEPSPQGPVISHDNVNVLKENNRQKRASLKSIPNITHRNHSIPGLKQYGIIFVNPSTNNNCDKNKTNLLDLLPFINKSMLPSEEWCIDYFPKSDEPKDDKVYDRIAAELEDLMYNEKKDSQLDIKNDCAESSVDDFPSIMDILNDNTEEGLKIPDNDSLALKPNLESSDVEAMLLGKSHEANKLSVCNCESESIEPKNDTNVPLNNVEDSLIDVGNKSLTVPVSTVDDSVCEDNENKPPTVTISTVNSLLSVADENKPFNEETSGVEHTLSNEDLNSKLLDHSQIQTTTDQIVSVHDSLVSEDVNSKPLEPTKSVPETDDNPHSPSILDEALQKGIEEHLPAIEEGNHITNGEIEDSKKSECTNIDVPTEVDTITKPMEVDTVPTPMEVDTITTPMQVTTATEEPKSENKIEKSGSKLEPETNEDNVLKLHPTDVTHVVFSNVKNGKCIKSVTCPKNLKYTIELSGKLVEFIGAPKFISSLEDLQVLLQIVNDSDLESLYVLHV